MLQKQGKGGCLGSLKLIMQYGRNRGNPYKKNIKMKTIKPLTISNG
jgi:hypothetical protein